MASEIRYARSAGVAIAYQVVGEGDTDLVYVSDYVSNLVYGWELPYWRMFYERLARSFRLILFDKRGTGLSDHGSQFATLETRMDDLRAVLDAVGSSSPVVLRRARGVWDGGAVRRDVSGADAGAGALPSRREGPRDRRPRSISRSSPTSGTGGVRRRGVTSCSGKAARRCTQGGGSALVRQLAPGRREPGGRVRAQSRVLRRPISGRCCRRSGFRRSSSTGDIPTARRGRSTSPRAFPAHARC